ncbi:MAG: carbamate kinase [Planctomycetota bacterium]|jgi:carbamate kinase|nr:carbamate kinase [Planctomycetota bacterium]
MSGKKKLAVIAIGGNSLIVGKKISVSDQYDAVRETTKHIADVIESGWQVVVTHGNGPQVGFLMLRAEMARRHTGLHILPLVSCVADTMGGIGYQIQQALHNELKKRGLPSNTVTLITQVLVDPNDPKFNDPDKFVGEFYDDGKATEVREEHPDWTMKKDANRGWRRVVPSPKPIEIIELDAVRSLADSGFNIVAAGGGGIPVLQKPDGSYVGVDAVIDKDLASRLLANKLGADLLVISTGVPQVAVNFGTEAERKLGKVDIAALGEYMAQGQFPAGSMGPKIQSAIDFIKAGGKEVIITSPENLGQAFARGAGTHVVP